MYVWYVCMSIFLSVFMLDVVVFCWLSECQTYKLSSASNFDTCQISGPAQSGSYDTILLDQILIIGLLAHSAFTAT